MRANLTAWCVYDQKARVCAGGYFVQQRCRKNAFHVASSQRRVDSSSTKESGRVRKETAKISPIAREGLFATYSATGVREVFCPAAWHINILLAPVKRLRFRQGRGRAFSAAETGLRKPGLWRSWR